MKETKRFNIKPQRRYSVVLEEETHAYYITDLETGDTMCADLSITELQRELGFTPNYSNVDEETLKKAAARGTDCHKALEELRTPNSNKSLFDYVDSPYYELIDNAYTGLTKTDLVPLRLEQKIVWQLADGRVVCGSIDEIGLDKDNALYVLDNKFTYEMHDLQVQTQTALYKAIVNLLAYNEITVNDFEFGLYYSDDLVDNYGEYACIKRYCNHKGSVYELSTSDNILKNYLGDLLELENGGIYLDTTPNLVESSLTKTLVNNQLELSQVNTLTLLAQEKELVEYENKVKEIKKLIAINRSKIQKAMEEQGIKSYELGNVKYTLVAPTLTKTFNADKAKEFLTDEELEQCYETKEKSGYLRIKVSE